MTRRFRSIVGVLVAAAVCVGSGVRATVAHAQQKDDVFKEGLDARDDKKWPEVAAAMRRAIRADGAESNRKVRRGIRDAFGGKEYLPYYFLGEALYYLGDCAGAVEAWAVSDQQGVVRALSEYKVLQKGYAACEEKGVLLPPEYTQLLSATRKAVTEITVLATTLAGEAEKHPELFRGELREQFDRARTELQNAHNRLATAERSRTRRDFADTSTSAASAGALLKSVDAQYRTAVNAVDAADRAFRQAEARLHEADEQVRALEARKATLAARPALAVVRQQIMDTLARARSQLAGAKGNAGAVREVERMADESISRVKALDGELIKVERDDRATRVAALVAPAEQALALVEDGFVTIEQRAAKRPADFTDAMVAQRDALRKETDTLRRRFESARRSESIQGLEEAARVAAELRGRLDEIIRIFGPLTIIDRGIRPELAEGARLYFEGDYTQALATLDLSRLAGIPYQEHVHLFRAAALHALYVRSGARDESLRTQAVAEVERCRLLKAGLEPDARAFGPRFIAFFQSVGAPATAAAAPSTPQQ